MNLQEQPYLDLIRLKGGFQKKLYLEALRIGAFLFKAPTIIWGEGGF